MFASILAQAAKVLAPFQKNAAGAGEIALAVSGTQVLVAIPEFLAGKYAEFTIVDNASGATVSCDVLFGNATMSLTYGQVSTVGANVITVNSATGRRLVGGTTRSMLVPVAAKAGFMAVIASAAGTLYIGVSSSHVK